MSDNSSQPQDAPSKPLETGYTPGDSVSTRWNNFFSLLMGKMTEEGKVQYKRDSDIRYEKSDCERCEKSRDYLLEYSAYHSLLSGRQSTCYTNRSS